MKFWKKQIPVIAGPNLKDLLAPCVPIFNEQASAGEKGDAYTYLKNLLREQGLG